MTNLNFDLRFEFVEGSEASTPENAHPVGTVHATMHKFGDQAEFSWSEFERVASPETEVAGAPCQTRTMPVISTTTGLICPRCGQEHRVFRLRPVQHAACAQCGTFLRIPSRFGPHALPALAVTAFVLAFPAMALPLVTLTKFGNRQNTFLMSGVDELNRRGLPHLAALVFTCAVVAPVILACLLAAWWFASRGKNTSVVAPRLHRALAFVQHWAMPEVFILGVLIAFVKLDRLVHVVARPGLWCYAAMAVAVLWAWRMFVLQYSSAAGPIAGRENP